MLTTFKIVMLLFLLTVIIVIFFKLVLLPFYYSNFKSKLSDADIYFLDKHFSFYQKLNPQRKLIFNNRVLNFLDTYQFIGRKDFVVTAEVKLLFAATFVMLTFGMKIYLIDNFNKIIVYPESYYSVITKEYHKGEFNPGLKALVFSWKDFCEGLRFDNDNLNLGLHEFTHALYFYALNAQDESSLIFAETYTKIQEYLVSPNVLNQLVMSNYFRIYAYSNQAEFLAVVLEHFFETPYTFKEEFPELFAYIKEMINFDTDDLF